MGFKFDDLELGSTSAVTEATDGQDGLTLDVVATAAERKALQEMLETAGRVGTFTLALGETFNVDPTGGLNTHFVTTAASSQVDSGWFAARGVSDSWQSRPGAARLRIDLVRLAGSDNAVGEASAATDFVQHDF